MNAGMCMFLWDWGCTFILLYSIFHKLSYCTLNGNSHPFSSSNRTQFMERHIIHGDILKHFCDKYFKTT